MSISAQIQVLEHKVEALINAEPDLFLVEVSIKPTNNIKVFIDGDQGVSIDKLVRYNRNLYRQIEEEKIFPNDDFSLEVSSPGLDEPLKLNRQYQKNIGRNVQVIITDGTIIEGKLLKVTETELLLEETKARQTGKNKNSEVGQGKGKKIETVERIINFTEIKSTRIQIKF